MTKARIETEARVERAAPPALSEQDSKAASRAAARARALVDAVINPVWDEYQDGEVCGDPMLNPIGEMKAAVIEKYPNADVRIVGDAFCVGFDCPGVGFAIVGYPFVAHQWEDSEGREGIELTSFGQPMFVEVRGGPLGWVRVVGDVSPEPDSPSPTAGNRRRRAPKADSSCLPAPMLDLRSNDEKRQT